MAAWRRRTLEQFPELARELQDPEFGIHQLFFELGTRVAAAHGARDDDALRAIYGFAQACLALPAKDLSNAAAVAFYEHVFDRWTDRGEVAPWLAPRVVAECRELWHWSLGPERAAELDELLRTCRTARWRD